MAQMDVRRDAFAVRCTDDKAGMAGGAQSPSHRRIPYQRTGKYRERMDPSLQLGIVWAALKPLRICAVRKSREQAERAKRKTRRQMRAPHKKPLDPTTVEMSEYFALGTSLPSDAFSAEQILELYRLRWQVELAFKRLKSIMQLGQLPKHDPESCRAWLYGKMLYALLCYAIVDKGRSFSPWGYLLK